MAREVLSNSLLHLGKLDRAADETESNLALRRELGERDNEPETMATLARIRIAKDDTDAAETLLPEAVEIARETDALYAEARVLRALGELEVGRGRLAQAHSRLETALDRFRDCGAVPDALGAIALLVDICETLGDDTAAGRWREMGDELASETDVNWDGGRVFPLPVPEGNDMDLSTSLE